MGKGQPKKNITPMKLRNKAFGTERRRNYPKEILYKETELPKPLNYDDIDFSFEEFVKDAVAKFNDTIYPVFTLYSNQRFSEYSQNWKHTDGDGNLLLNFITVNRDSNPKPGSNQGELWNIPGNRYYTMLIKNVLEDNGTESYEIYSMKQPYAVDLTYRINFMTSTYDNINDFNNRVNELFKARQCYIRPNGHFIPMVIEEVNDETSYSIDERRFFLQSIGIKVMAYIINKEDFKVEKKPKRIMTFMEGDTKRPAPTVDIDEYESNNPLEYRSMDLTIGFEKYHDKVEFDIDSDMNIETIEKTNIRSIRVFVNDTPYYTDKGFKLKNGDNVKIKIRKFDTADKAKIVFSGFNPNETYNSEYVPEKVSDEVTKHESIIID